MDSGSHGARAGALLKVLAVLAIVVVGSVVDTNATRVPAASAGEPQRDIELFRAVVERARSGTPIYEAMGTELRLRRYPTASVFNWRTPLLYAALTAIGPVSARALLISLACLLVTLTVVVLRPRSTPALMIGLFLQVGVFISVAVASAPFLTEVWAGVLLGLSLCAYQMRAWRTAAGLGLLALFVRELAAPYVVICALLAVRDRRWSEITIWLAGAVGYAIYFAWHVHEVTMLHTPADLAHADSWLYGGGPAFLMRTLRTNAWLLLAPGWIPSTSALLAVLLAAAAWPSTAPRLRATAVAYLALFLMVGQPFNQYWGLVTAPLWPVVAAEGVDALRHWLAIARPPGPPRASVV